MKDTGPIKAADNETYAFPTSYAQQRLWFLQRLEPDSPAYNVPATFRLSGPVNVAALEKSFQEIVGRHEVLRTTFALIDGEPKQIVAPTAPLQMQLINIRSFPEIEREKELGRCIAREANQSFDLEKGPLLRVSLVQIDEDEHVLLINMHHIVSDGWSMPILFGELTELYKTYSKKVSASLAELPVQYADYAIWQREWLTGGELERQLSYWKKQLEGAPAALNFPTDRPRPAVQSFRGASQSMTLSIELSEKLKTFSRSEGVTLFMTLLAAFQTMLHRYTGQEDIVVGTPIANRTRSEIEGLIGFFVNTLVLRGNFTGNPTFRELLTETRRIALDAYDHQDLPFEKLVEELKPERSLSYSPLFQVMFILQNAPEKPLSFEGLSVSHIRTGSETAKFDLTLSVHERPQGLTASLQYNTDLFEAATVTRLLKHFETLLRGIVDDPKQRISELPLLTEAEERQVLIDWSGVRESGSHFGDVIQMFEQQVERTPDALALAFQDISLSYDELNRRANQLAHYLAAQGVRRDACVAVCIERSPEFALGFLAILKAGGAYVPLDPSYPRDRLLEMMRDLEPLLLITTQSQISQFSSFGVSIIALNAAQETIAEEERANPQSATASESPAYVLYTSGSTGKPKGVVMSRGALGNLISWQIANLSEPAAARTLQFAPCGFDVSIQEMLATWCSGGSLFLIEDELRRDGLRLLRFIQERSIERVFLPFVALQNLAEAAAYGNCYPPSLREIITAGEQLQMTISLRSFLRRLDNCRLRNQYGPTESHVATQFVLNPPFEDAADLPPIGRPIANTQIYILDPQHNPAPIGVPGEICIGGVGLACGYLNQPELTAEKFIDWSPRGRPPARLYRTGDCGRYLPDGNIEFLGRIDRQVKMHGFRIELGEIEAALGRCPGVHNSAVVAFEAAPMDKRLVAYVTLHERTPIGAPELRAYLKEKLPDYMVPSTFVFLDTLPLTPSGKLDRARLPAPEFSQASAFVPPRTPVEEQLAAIWVDLLRLDRVGVHDNFFDLGGHSLLATRLASKIKEVFGIELALRAIFELPTVAGLSGHIEAVCWMSVGMSGTTNSDQEQAEEIIL